MYNSYILITFPNMTKALIAEEMLIAFNVRTIPTPSFISHSCGLSIRAQEKYKTAILDLMNNDPFEYEKIFLITDKEYEVLKGE